MMFDKKRIELDPEMEARKQKAIDKARDEKASRRAAEEAQLEKERICGASPLGHVYELSRAVSTFPRSTYVCVGCGKEVLRR